MGKLDGISAIITGGSRGQGAAHAARFVAEGACVIVGDMLVDEGELLADSLGERCRFVRMDVSEASDWDTAVRLASSLAPLRVLVNNAAIHWSKRLDVETAEGFSKLLSVNLLGPFLGIQAVTEPMRAAGGGSIVNVASIAARQGFVGHAAYGSSKSGLLGLSRVAAVELGPSGIRVNTVLPGAIDTPMMSGTASDDRFSSLPLGRCGTVDDVADVVLFLASSDSAYLTGTEITIDGGSTVGKAPRTSGAL